MSDEYSSQPWQPHEGMSGLFLSFGILIALIARQTISATEAHEILDGQMILLEQMLTHPGTGEGARARISAGLSDLSHLRNMLQSNPATRLPT